jgi:exosortase/archaeosortase family protein
MLQGKRVRNWNLNSRLNLLTWRFFLLNPSTFYFTSGMKLRDILLSRKAKVFAISTLILLFTYIILRFIIFDSDPLVPFVYSVANSYLLLIEKFANLILLWTGSPMTIQNHIILLNGTQLSGFIPEIMYKKVVIIFLFLFWLTRTSSGKKICFTVLLLVISFLFVSIYNAVGAHLAANDTDYISSVLSIPHSIGYLCIITILFIWYRYNKESILNSLSKLSINTKLLEKIIFEIFIVIYIYIIVIWFFYLYFDFNLWIDFLFKSSQKILSIFGYDAKVEPSLLIGNNGSIYMAKACLGFKTMFLFASIVYLTGNDNKRRWIYIISGLLFLNFVNIIRFVLLFIHIQKHGGYVLAMDLHDMYNYITYFIVFILWIIWFEKFADIRSSGRKVPEVPGEI